MTRINNNTHSGVISSGLRCSSNLSRERHHWFSFARRLWLFPRLAHISAGRRCFMIMAIMMIELMWMLSIFRFYFHSPSLIHSQTGVSVRLIRSMPLAVLGKASGVGTPTLLSTSNLVPDTAHRTRRWRRLSCVSFPVLVEGREKLVSPTLKESFRRLCANEIDEVQVHNGRPEKSENRWNRGRFDRSGRQNSQIFHHSKAIN